MDPNEVLLRFLSSLDEYRVAKEAGLSEDAAQESAWALEALDELV